MQETRWIQRFENYKTALDNLDETVECINRDGISKIYTMALVQAFEIAFELAWKTIKDYLEYSGIKTDTPREAIKSAFSNNLIEDGKIWILMMEARNKTSHTYNQSFAKELANEILNEYTKQLHNLSEKLGEKL
ncbi:nucleotidyltransferase substrate binding protein [bacterium]|uniref:Nucleotidyltransferase substrate binding protein n=1 Tax=Candidatus Scatenecus faecavium TaxID=2840915 RepID=A0A9D1K4U3_9BACT|nr:nucleotidyltransferase substrate binding protein [bacterium]HIS82719.1 nucleotidyltransferase substrate binding protein [Candidatus Scatenecus faecavium]